MKDLVVFVSAAAEKKDLLRKLAAPLQNALDVSAAAVEKDLHQNLAAPPQTVVVCAEDLPFYFHCHLHAVAVEAQAQCWEEGEGLG